MTEPKVEFGELPPDGRGEREPNGKWAQIAEALRVRPGVWAKVHAIAESAPRTGAGNVVSGIKHGTITRAMLPSGSFEAVSRGRDIWARYVGDPS